MYDVALANQKVPPFDVVIVLKSGNAQNSELLHCMNRFGADAKVNGNAPIEKEVVDDAIHRQLWSTVLTE